MKTTEVSVSSAPPSSCGGALRERIADEIANAGGWLGFERYMELALYAPGLGYYARDDRQFGVSARSGSDFVTAPELSPLFGRALARQIGQALEATGTREVWEFGAGSGALAAQLLGELGERIDRYVIVDLSGVLRERQRTVLTERVPQWAPRAVWLDALPPTFEGVVVGNEVLDAMPVALLHFDGREWHERGVALHEGRFVFADRPTDLRPPLPGNAVPGAITELPRHAGGFMRTLAQRLARGAAFFIDYGFPEAEYHHPQRSGGTLMCHRAHRMDTDPLQDVGEKDITAHVDFTAMALAGQDAGLHVLGYTSQARFLMNCGLLEHLQAGITAGDIKPVAAAQKLLAEHEMGELFKVIGFAAGAPFDALGFARGDRSHTL
ncbi:SAM-dependent methyltransferase [Methylibium sp.]|uniref:class I SAM-dependent methyltransferase n=1 Tax=Methylibium sp. TaxID=2067992 RepID=UPI0025CFBF32|nr:SAM-dependent methyltransferase [Methylibium sp.]